jgi:hypothetical protein
MKALVTRLRALRDVIFCDTCSELSTPRDRRQHQFDQFHQPAPRYGWFR